MTSLTLSSTDERSIEPDHRCCVAIDAAMSECISMGKPVKIRGVDHRVFSDAMRALLRGSSDVHAHVACDLEEKTGYRVDRDFESFLALYEWMLPEAGDGNPSTSLRAGGQSH